LGVLLLFDILELDMFSVRKREKTGIVFHIETASVRGAAFLFGGTLTKPRILARTAVTFEVSEVFAHHEPLQRIRRAMEEVLSKISKDLPMPPETAILGLSSPLYLAKTVKVSRERKQPKEPISEKELNALLAAAEEDFKTTAFNDAVDEITIFSRNRFSTRLNGYKVDDPVKLSAKTIEVAARLEVSTQPLLDLLKKTIQQRFPSTQISYLTLPVAYFKGVQSLLNTDDGFVLIDIGQDVTEVSIVNQGLIQESQSISEGLRHVTEKLSHTKHMAIQETISLLQRYAQKSLDDTTQHALHEAITGFVAPWKQSFEKILAQIHADEELPTIAFLTGVGSALPAYKEMLTFSNMTLLRSEALTDKFDQYGYLAGPEDFGLACMGLLLTGNTL
jgi:hypothetical protein